MNYRCETDLAAIKDYLQNAPVVAFDFETAPLLQYRDDPRAALDAHRACIVGISLSVAEDSALACINGRFVAFEVKTETGKLTKLQEITIQKIRNAKGQAFKVTSAAEVAAILKELEVMPYE